MLKDYYSILEIDETATQEQIRAAFKKQTLKWHPDRNPEKDTTESMQEINEAYLILKDFEAKERYDREYKRFKQFQKQKEQFAPKHEYHKDEKKYEYKREKTEEYSVHDDILGRWIENAKKQAVDLAKKSIEDLIGMGSAGAKAAVKEAGLQIGYQIIIGAGILFFGLVITLIKSCNTESASNRNLSELLDSAAVHNPYSKWFLLDSIDFEIYFPHIPKVHPPRKINSEFGFIEGKIFSYMADEDELSKDGNIAFILGYSDFPGVDQFNDKKKLEFFNLRREGMIANSNGKMLLEEIVFYKDIYEGRKWRASLDDGRTISNSHGFLVGTRFYFIQVLTKRQYDHNEDIYKFLSSFTLEDSVKPANKSVPVSTNQLVEKAQTSSDTEFEHYIIKDVGYISIPPNMEIQSGAYKKYAEGVHKKIGEKVFGYELSDNRVVLQQKGTNDFKETTKSLYARVIIETTIDRFGEYNTLDQKMNVSQIELNETSLQTRDIMKESFKGTGLKIVEWYGIELVKVNGVNASKISFLRQLNENPPVYVEIYHFENNDRMHSLIFSYRKNKQEIWKPTFQKVLDSFTITHPR